MTANKHYKKRRKERKPQTNHHRIRTGTFIQSFRLKLVWLDATVHGMKKYVASFVSDIGHTTAFLKRRRTQ